MRLISELLPEPVEPINATVSLTSYKRDIKLTKLDLDEPVPPIIPTVSPDFMCKFISCNTYFLLPFL